MQHGSYFGCTNFYLVTTCVNFNFATCSKWIHYQEKKMCSSVEVQSGEGLQKSRLLTALWKVWISSRKKKKIQVCIV